MAYYETFWKDGVTPASAKNMNKIERQLSILDKATEHLQKQLINIELNGTHAHLNKEVLDSFSLTKGKISFNGTVLASPLEGDVDTHYHSVDRKWENIIGRPTKLKDFVEDENSRLVSDVEKQKWNSAEANAKAYSSALISQNIQNIVDYTDNKIAELVDSAPEALNTLNELSNALGNDANFSTTVLNKLAGYVHDQIVSATVWIINHPLNKYPSITIVDTSGNVVLGDIKFVSTSQIKLTFSSEFSGKVYLN